MRVIPENKVVYFLFVPMRFTRGIHINSDGIQQSNFSSLSAEGMHAGTANEKVET